jgi:ParB family chromosome partitioning protein
MAGKKDNPYLKKPTGAIKAPARVEKRHGLGRGLDGLLQSAPKRDLLPVPAAPAASPLAPLEVKIVDIERSPYQPRRDFKPEELSELAESLRHGGLVHPPTVRKNAAGRYELISGERRLRAAQLIGWTKIRVTLVEADDLTAALMTTSENLQREDLNPLEEAASYKALQDLFGLTQADVAERVGKGRATVANAVRLLELPDEVKTLVGSNLLSVGHAKVLLSLESEKDRILFARECVNGQLTVRALEKKVARQLSPVAPKAQGTPDIPDSHVRSIADALRRHLGCAVRLTSGITHANGRRTKGVLEIDFFDNDELDRVLKMIGVNVD